MASKGIAVEAMEYKPCVYLKLPSKDMLDGLKLGDKVEIIIKATVKSMSSSTSQYDGKAEENHSLDLEDYKLKMVETGTWDDLMEDD